ncbi:hypothetical protein M409DRAFT_65543 [Zasmidium cellare ATCC 36951]|uniref:Isochorismatase-like domain-containing protein n=1 Tax=Zasmidium cellare ATCC 36951 TaxID=1080233 RepID=A0A6A6CNP9_ZASCE|nr:uncharacterized protein M409DRAFT_65543 [Zasmidium cellare ATCC 36951]KAF2168671.1 hypothetical protein M409DRAFT_65543 [Zasmidium cellare ATCC 36951]
MTLPSRSLGLIACAAALCNSVGYNCHPTCIPPSIPANESSKLSFGKYYVVLNLDVENGAVIPYENNTAGKAWISNLACWIHAVHRQSPPPLSIYTAVAYVNSHKLELGVQSGEAVPFVRNGAPELFGAADTKTTKIYERFYVNETAGDVVLPKARFYAGAGNQLEEILRAQKIDTVVLSGIATSGVVLATALRLFDLDYNVYVVLNNTFQAGAKTSNQEVNEVILTGILPLLPVKVITLEQAVDALGRSGPAKY